MAIANYHCDSSSSVR